MATKTKSKPKTKLKSVEDKYDRMRQKWKESSSSSEFWKPPKGSPTSRSVIRLFWFKHEGQEELFVQTAKHWNLNVDGNKPITCPGIGCPICALKNSLDEDVFSKIRANQGFLYNAILVNEDKRHVVAQLAWSVHQELRDYIMPPEKDEESPLYVPHCTEGDKGRNFTIHRTDKGITKYKVSIDTKPSKIELPEPFDLYDRIPDPPSMEELKKIAKSFE